MAKYILKILKSFSTPTPVSKTTTTPESETTNDPPPQQSSCPFSKMEQTIPNLPYDQPFDVAVPVSDNETPTKASECYLKGAVITYMDIFPLQVGYGRWYKILALQRNHDLAPVSDQRNHLKIRHHPDGNLKYEELSHSQTKGRFVAAQYISKDEPLTFNFQYEINDSQPGSKPNFNAIIDWGIPQMRLNCKTMDVWDLHTGRKVKAKVEEMDLEAFFRNIKREAERDDRRGVEKGEEVEMRFMLPVRGDGKQLGWRKMAFKPQRETPSRNGEDRGREN